MSLTLGFIFETLVGYRPADAERTISSVVIDSRQAQPGTLFIAFQGEHVDGHDYVQDAFARGAIAALVEHPIEADCWMSSAGQPTLNQLGMAGQSVQKLCLQVENTLAALQALARAWRNRFQLRVVGITGSVGKTSTKELTHSVLAQRFHTLKSRHNYNNPIGLPLTLLNLRPEHQRVVLEMGMFASGEIALLCDLARPDVGVVTNIGPVHLERLGSIAAIVAAKQELVEALPAAPEGVAILNADEPLVMGMAQHTKAQIITYGLTSDANIWADDIQSIGLDGLRFSLHFEQEAFRLRIPLLGRHSVYTALRAAAVGFVEGLSWEEIIAGLESLDTQLRLVAVPGPKGATILNDSYNSSPESAAAALDLLLELDGRRIAVLGDMLELGPVEEESHRSVGRRAMNVAHVLVAVGKRGRLIGEEALACGMPADRVFLAADAGAALSILADIVASDDVILIKGSRGAHLEEVVAALQAGMKDELAGKRLIILGLARQGKALARFAAEAGAKVTVSDLRSPEELQSALDDLDDLAIDYVFNEHPMTLLEGADVLAISGGVPTGLPLVAAARRRGLPLTNDAQEFLRRCPAPVIGITGSAGKTTTTALTALISQTAGRRTWMGGNIGRALIADLANITVSDLVVQELSSFQLELCAISPQIAAVLNVTPNHLDRHQTMAAYAGAKANILHHQGSDGVAILSADDPGALSLRHLVRGRLRLFSADRPVEDGAYVRDGKIWLRNILAQNSPQFVCRLTDIRLRGQHNVHNVLAAVTLADSAGLPLQAMRQAISSFTGVEHRLQLVRTLDGVQYVNDSIATAPERSLAAIASFDEPVILLAGGRDKDLDWAEWAAQVSQRTKAVILFGELGELLEERLVEASLTAALKPGRPGRAAAVLRQKELARAVATAHQMAVPGDVVLLAPGGTSFDTYPDFAARGEDFTRLVLGLSSP